MASSLILFDINMNWTNHYIVDWFQCDQPIQKTNYYLMIDSFRDKTMEPQWHFLVNEVPCILKPAASALKKEKYGVVSQQLDEANQQKDQQYNGDASFVSFSKRFAKYYIPALRSRQLQHLLDNKPNPVYMPKDGLLFRKINNTYEATQIQMQSYSMSQSNQENNLKQQSINTLPKDWLLYSWLRLGFVKLSFQQFKTLFEKDLLLAKIRLNSNPNAKNFIYQNISCPPLQQIKRSQQQENGQEIKCYELIDRESVDWSKVIFDRLPLSNGVYVYWPCVVLRPLSDPQSRLSKVKNKMRVRQHQYYEDELSCFSQILQDIQSQRPINRDKDASHLHQQLFSLVQQQSQISELQNNEDRYLLKLMGTDVILNDFVLPWKDQDKRLAQNFKTKQKYIYKEFQKYIKSFNQLKKLQQLPLSQGSEGSFCIYSCNKPQVNFPAIILKYSEHKKNKVLIQIVGSKSQKLLWTDMKYVHVNLALPALSKWQISKFVDCRNNKDNQDVNVNTSFHNNQHRVICYSCKYQIKTNHQIFQCQSCFNYWHVDCLCQNQDLHKSSLQTKQLCPLCKPCEFCNFRLKQDRIKCTECDNEYHPACIKLEIDRNYSSNHQDFVCYNCSKCKQCSRLVPLQQIREKGSVICNQCYRQKKENQCAVCAEQLQQDKRPLVCSYNQCRNAVHRKCDILQKDGITIPADKYRCPTCRIRMRRQLLKMLVNELRRFDQMQYYFQPSYENINNYERIVDRPICVMIINDRISEGIYDNQPLTTLKNDFRNIIDNALSFNQVKSDPFYRAKILYIIGHLFLEQVGKCIDVGDYQLLTGNMYQVFEKRMFQFYYWLRKNYFVYLLNYSNARSIFEINYQEKLDEYNEEQGQYEVFKFISSSLIRQQLTEGAFSLRLPFKTDQISALLSQIKTQKAVYQSLAKPICYYHPEQKLPIIYECELCWQTYCCTRHCPRHKKRGQIKFSCKCVRQDPQNDKIELQSKAKKMGITIEQLTQFYSKCLSCVEKDMETKLCYICQNLCNFGYRQCKKCLKYFHIKCAVTHQKAHWQWYVELKELGTCCVKCWSTKQRDRFGQLLVELARIRMHKLDKIKDYMHIFKCILESQGLTISDSEAIRKFYNRFEQVMYRESYFQFLVSHKEGQSMFQLFRKYLKQKIHSEDKQLKDEVEQYFLMKSNKNAFSLVNRKIRAFYNEWNTSLVCQLDQNTNQEQPSDSQDQTNQKDTQQFLGNTNPHCWQNYNLQHSCQELIKNNSNEYDDKIFADHPISLRQHNFISVLIQSSSKNKSSNNFPINETKYYKQSVGRIAEYLRFFVLRVFQEQNQQWRKGNTSLIQCGEQRWCCVKKFKNNSYKFQIFKQNEKWSFSINEITKKVQSLRQILHEIQYINPNIKDMPSLVTFLGLNLKINLPQKISFTQMLQVNRMQDLTRRQRKSVINQYLKVQNRKTYQNDRLLGLMKDNKSTITQRSEIFYIKRKQIEEQKQNNNRNRTYSKFDTTANLSKQDPNGRHGPQKIKITYEDIRRDLGLVNEINPNMQAQLANQTTLDCLYVSVSKIDRLGLFTKQRIPPHTAVIQYVGQLLSQPVADLRQKQYRRGCYMFALQASNDRFDVIDATVKGNMARYLNHSCDANCRAVRVRKAGMLPRIVVYTVKQVQKNEELTYDYQFKVESKQRIFCKCKSNSCQGRLN